MRKSFKYKGSAMSATLYIYDKGFSFYPYYCNQSANIEDYSYNSYYTHNKMALYIGDEDFIEEYDDIEYYLESIVDSGRYSSIQKTKAGTVLFISKSCKVPRDIIRNSGYKITIDPDKADYIITPTMKSKGSFEEKHLHIAMTLGDTLYLIQLREKRKGKDGLARNLSQEDIQALKEWFLDKYPDADIFLTDDCSLFNLYFGPKIQEWEDIVLQSYPSRRYVSEAYLELDCANEVSPDTLMMWKNMEDNIMYKSIVNSNWQNFPLSINLLLQLRNIYGLTGNGAFDNILKQLGYSNTGSFRGIKTNAEDWNTAQKFLMRYLGTSEEGGYISMDRYNTLTYGQKVLLNTRMAIKPYLVDKDIQFRSEEMMDNIKSC